MSFKEPTDQLQRSLFAFCKEHGVLPSEVELVTNDIEMTAHFRLRDGVISRVKKAAEFVSKKALNNIEEKNDA